MLNSQNQQDNHRLRCAAFRALRESADMSDGPKREAGYGSAIAIFAALNPPKPQALMVELKPASVQA